MRVLKLPRITTWPGLLETWSTLTNVKYHENLKVLINLNQLLALTPGGGGGGTLIWNRRGCSSEFFNLTPKGDHLGVAEAFCDP